MKKIKINFWKVAFLMCNFIFLLSGICLVLLGCLLVNDAPRILLSQLIIEPGVISQPFLYYAALAFISVGLIVCVVALIGCWVSWTPDSNWLLGTYMILLIILLFMETSFGAVVSLCPQIIGVLLDRDQMVSGLMNNYGVPGRSQYTAAVDLAQTLFECCGMQSGSDYDGSKWWKREQDTMHNLRVPHSCCFLSNTDDENSFLNPKPLNSSLCQAKTNSRYQYGRHVKGCIDKLNAWFKDHITIFLIIGLALVVVQLAVLLCAILVCLKKQKPPTSSINVESSLRNSSKNQKRTEKNLTPKLERKNASAQIDIQRENNFNLEQQICTSESMKVRNSQIFGDNRGKDSFLSLPLVLRNDHFWNYDNFKNKSTSNSARRNSPITQEKKHEQEPNVYFTPYYPYTGKREDDTSQNSGDELKLNGNLKNYFVKSENHEVDNSCDANERKEKFVGDCFDAERVPSQEPKVFQSRNYPELWNTVGIPSKETFSPIKHQDKNQVVRKAVRDIELGLYKKEYKDHREDIIEEKIDITQTKLYWQEKERASNDQTLTAPAATDFCTDFPADWERDDENVIVLKVNRSDGLILKPDSPVLLSPVPFKKKLRKPKKAFSKLLVENENLLDYEKNWNQKIGGSFNFEGSLNYFRSDHTEEMNDSESKILKYQNISYPNKMESMSQIPRVKMVGVGKFCRVCNNIIEREHSSRCVKLKSDNCKYTLEKRLSSERMPENAFENKDDRISHYSQGTPKNFFENSGKYTLRCNLNQINKVSNDRKKFYLTPETLQFSCLKKLKEPKLSYENFVAKKREFKRRRMDFCNHFDSLKQNYDTIMW